jgi:hypothetical protein
MTLPLNRETIAACYDFLCTTPPFNGWNLPPSEDVKFRVVRSPDVRGWYMLGHDNSHTIAISSRCIGRTNSLVETLAHEMIHLHMGHTGMANGRAEHPRSFWILADKVCAVHGFDPRLF